MAITTIKMAKFSSILHVEFIMILIVIFLIKKAFSTQFPIY